MASESLSKILKQVPRSGFFNLEKGPSQANSDRDCTVDHEVFPMRNQ